MKIAVIAAMDKEVALLQPLLEEALEAQGPGGLRYLTGRVGSHRVAVCQCGIGKVNAALRCQALIDAFRPEMVLNTGVAGGTGSEARVMDVVAADEVAYHDVWCGPGTAPGQAAGCPARFAADRRVMDLPALRGARHGLVCSGDVFVSDPAVLSGIVQRYPQVLAVDMESAALAQTCHLAGVPFAAIRVVSDTPGRHQDNASQYEDFWTAAPRQTFGVIRDVLHQLPE